MARFVFVCTCEDQDCKCVWIEVFSRKDLPLHAYIECPKCKSTDFKMQDFESYRHEVDDIERLPG